MTSINIVLSFFLSFVATGLFHNSKRDDNSSCTNWSKFIPFVAFQTDKVKDFGCCSYVSFLIFLLLEMSGFFFRSLHMSIYSSKLNLDRSEVLHIMFLYTTIQVLNCDGPWPTRTFIYFISYISILPRIFFFLSSSYTKPVVFVLDKPFISAFFIISNKIDIFSEIELRTYLGSAKRELQPLICFHFVLLLIIIA